MIHSRLLDTDMQRLLFSVATVVLFPYYKGFMNDGDHTEWKGVLSSVASVFGFIVDIHWSTSKTRFTNKCTLCIQAGKQRYKNNVIITIYWSSMITCIIVQMRTMKA